VIDRLVVVNMEAALRKRLGEIDVALVLADAAEDRPWREELLAETRRVLSQLDGLRRTGA
jgi:hypothetical protein